MAKCMGRPIISKALDFLCLSTTTVGFTKSTAKSRLGTTMISFQWPEGTRVVQLKEERKKEGRRRGGRIVVYELFPYSSVDIDDTPCTAQD